MPSNHAITFELAILGEALRKAQRAAAKKNSDAFGKSAGIVLDEVNPETREVRVRSTDAEVFLMQWIAYEEFEGDPELFRVILPSEKSAAVVSSIKSPAGKKITLRLDSGIAHFTCGRMVAQLRTIHNPGFPVWEPFDATAFGQCEGLGAAISRVSWARLRETNEPMHLTGVFVDEGRVYATDSHVLAVQPFKTPSVTAPVSVPPELIAAFIRDSGDVAVAVTDSFFCIQPDDWSQIKTVLFAGQPPGIDRIMRTDYRHTVVTEKHALVGALATFAEIGIKAEAPLVDISTTGIELTLFMTDGEQSVSNTFDLTSETAHDAVEMRFNLRLLHELVSKTPGSAVKMHYDPASERGKPRLYVEGTDGYQSWLAEIRK